MLFVVDALRPTQCPGVMPPLLRLVGVFANVEQARRFSTHMPGRKRLEPFALSALASYETITREISARRNAQVRRCTCLACVRECVRRGMARRDVSLDECIRRLHIDDPRDTCAQH